ncbi:sporulation initiation inhibitor protein Soj (plasmid) [Fulvitalea axinellae]|uniref:Sporulation initiation inhibitor protein Soj n=1 Tax=Fulvitalea axinellae TaxID=1182444 RepID=A0AAU9DCK9_9BACT|nr:sporulation initiation inhibitor protein Soj [Fulvitalea axinellae]
MLNNDKVIAFFQRNPALSISMIEKEAGLPMSLLSKVLRGERKLNDDHLKKIRPVLVKYGYNNKIVSEGTKVIAVLNHKGGVGKTTTTFNLGKALSLHERKVLIVDLDPQGNLTQCTGNEEPEKQLHHAFGGEDLPVLELAENFHLVPAGIELSSLELEMQSSINGYFKLQEVLDPIKHNYDYVLIDCPPSLGILTTNALIASDSALIVVQSHYLATKGLGNIIEMIDQLQTRLNPELKVEGMLLTMVDKRTVISQTIIDFVKENYPYYRVFDSLIRQNVALIEASSQHMDVISYDNKSIGARDYLDFCKEVMNG